jgi:hypothetical protein
VKGLFNQKLKDSIDLKNNLNLLENFASGVEEKQQKAKVDEENK